MARSVVAHVNAPTTGQIKHFFVRLAQSIVRSLSKQTIDGIAYRVDTRLRPYGADSQLAVSVEFLQSYLANQARDWERFAYAKADCLGANSRFNRQLQQTINRYVFRPYTDFGLLQSMRKLRKQAIHNDNSGRSDLINSGPMNIKTMSGGIRMLEFVVQMHQFLHYSQFPKLRVRGAFSALAKLQQCGVLKNDDSTLRDALIFFRRLEHRLQIWDDRQTHQLPPHSHDRLWQWLVDCMKPANQCDFSKQHLLQQLSDFQSQVQTIYQCLVPDEPPPRKSTNPIAIEPLSQTNQQGLVSYAESMNACKTLSNVSSTVLTRHINDFLNSRKFSSSSLAAQQRAHQLISLIKKIVASQNKGEFKQHPLNEQQRINSQLTIDTEAEESKWTRLFRLINAITQRSVYTSLLIEYPNVLKKIIHWCEAEPYLIQEVIQFPRLMELLISETLSVDDVRTAQLKKLWQPLEIDETNTDQKLNQLREFKRSAFFEVAMLVQQRKIDSYQASDLLTGFAKQVIRHGLDMAVQEIKSNKTNFSNFSNQSLLVVGYGKLGSFELGFGSDIDCVVLFDDTNKTLQRDDLEMFSLKVVRRFQQILALKTISGHCFEVDFRLRPDGNKGVLVTGLEQYADYLNQRAWMWEKQALIKAKAVAGSYQLAKRFAKVRKDTLRFALNGLALNRQALNRLALKKLSSKHPQQNLSEKELPYLIDQHISSVYTADVRALAEAISGMRQKMRQQLDRSNSSMWDIKQGEAGLVDIEFLMQYWVLCYARDYPKLLTHRSVSSIARCLVDDGLVSNDIDLVVQRYLQLRNILTKQTMSLCKHIGMLTYDDDQLMNLEETGQVTLNFWQSLFDNESVL